MHVWTPFGTLCAVGYSCICKCRTCAYDVLSGTCGLNVVGLALRVVGTLHHWDWPGLCCPYKCCCRARSGSGLLTNLHGCLLEHLKVVEDCDARRVVCLTAHATPLRPDTGAGPRLHGWSMSSLLLCAYLTRRLIGQWICDKLAPRPPLSYHTAKITGFTSRRRSGGR